MMYLKSQQEVGQEVMLPLFAALKGKQLNGSLLEVNVTEGGEGHCSLKEYASVELLAIIWCQLCH